MSKELVISANRHETRVAILEDDQVVEVYHQRENEYSLAGSIHKGRVTRVLPGMQSAFVDIGLDRDAFLYVSDFFEDNEEYDKIVTSVEEKVLKLDRTPAQVQAAQVAADAPRPAEGEPAEAEPTPTPVEASFLAEPVVPEPATVVVHPVVSNGRASGARQRMPPRNRARWPAKLLKIELTIVIGNHPLFGLLGRHPVRKLRNRNNHTPIYHSKSTVP